MYLCDFWYLDSFWSGGPSAPLCNHTALFQINKASDPPSETIKMQIFVTGENCGASTNTFLCSPFRYNWNVPEGLLKFHPGTNLDINGQ
jgi:hypothetical protein